MDESAKAHYPAAIVAKAKTAPLTTAAVQDAVDQANANAANDAKGKLQRIAWGSWMLIASGWQSAKQWDLPRIALPVMMRRGLCKC